LHAAWSVCTDADVTERLLTHGCASSVPGAYTLRGLVNVTIACMNTAQTLIDTSYTGTTITVTSSSPALLIPSTTCTFVRGVCWAGLQALQSGTFTITPSPCTTLTCIAASLTVSPTPPIIYSIGQDGCVTNGGCELVISGVAFVDAAVCSTPPVLTFANKVTGITTTASLISYNSSTIVATVPRGQGAPEVVVTVCGVRQTHLPRWPNDVFFWQGNNVPQTPILPYCNVILNTNDQYTHTWSQSYFCGSSFRAIIDWQFFQPRPLSFADPVPAWYKANYKCTQMYEPNEFYMNYGVGGWPNSFFCYPNGLPWQLTYQRTGPVDGQFCVQLGQTSDPYWAGGSHYLCNPTNVPYGADLIQLYHYQAPFITSVIVGNGTSAGTITVIGTSFGQGQADTLDINGLTCSPLSWNDSQVICTLPAGLGSNQPLTVTVEGVTSNSYPFSYPPPEISSIFKPNGTTQGGETITIYGSSFGPCCTGTVTVGGLACTGATNPASNWNSTAIVCVVPAGTGLGNQVQVTIGGQTNIVPGYYDRIPPVIYSYTLTPNNADSSGGPILFLNGTSFSLNSVVRIGGYLCPPTVPQTHTAIYCQLPPGQGANLSIVVTTSAGLVSNKDKIFSYNPPVITALSPAVGVSGQTVYLALSGVAQAASFGLSGVVTIGSSTCFWDSTTGFWSHSLINCLVPSGTGSQLPVQITVGGQSSNILYFSYAPVITNVTVVSGSPTTAGGAVISLAGTAFNIPAFSNDTILVGTSVCTIIARTDTGATCTLPPGEGSTTVSITVNGYTSPTVPFTYLGPQVTSISPANGTTAGGNLVTITGSSFSVASPTSTTVTIGGQPCVINTAFSSLSGTRIVCAAPAGTGASQQVIVSVAGQTNSSAYYSYNPPSILSLSPSNGVAAGGYTVGVSGLNFGAPSVPIFAVVGGVLVSVTAHNDTYLTLNVPAGIGSLDIKLLVALQSSNIASFIYDPPMLTSISPARGDAAGGYTVVLQGLSLGSSGTVKIGTQTCVQVPPGTCCIVPLLVIGGCESEEAERRCFFRTSDCGTVARLRKQAGRKLTSPARSQLAPVSTCRCRSRSAPRRVTR
jgi:hypothetical protein